MMSGHKMRILSSENDASVKVQQDQNTNITLKVEHSQPDMLQQQQPINFTTTNPYDIQQPSNVVQYPSTFQAAPASTVQERSIDLTDDIADKDAQISVLEALLACYENNPIMINKFVVCSKSVLMDIIKTLTGGEKVEFILDEDKSCSCCNSKYIYISKILVTSNGKTQEFKYGWNEKYSLLQKHGISLKICY